MAFLIGEIFVRILEMLLVPYFDKEVIWTIAPLLFVLVMIQMYFGRYKTEQLGWNTAFGNTVSVMWVTVLLYKFMHDVYTLKYAWFSPTLKGYIILIGILGLVTLVLAILDFNHIIPKKYAFLISSALPLNISAFFIILIVIGKIPLDGVTLQAVAVLFIFFVALFYLYKKIITPAKSILPTLEKRQKAKAKLIRKEEKKVKKAVGKAIWKVEHPFNGQSKLHAKTKKKSKR